MRLGAQAILVRDEIDQLGVVRVPRAVDAFEREPVGSMGDNHDRVISVAIARSLSVERGVDLGCSVRSARGARVSRGGQTHRCPSARRERADPSRAIRGPCGYGSKASNPPLLVQRPDSSQIGETVPLTTRVVECTSPLDRARWARARLGAGEAPAALNQARSAQCEEERTM